MAMAALPLNIDCCFYDGTENTPASQLAHVEVGAFDDHESLIEWAQGLDVITYDWENVPVDALRALKSVAPIYPKPNALKVAQDRLFEKNLFTTLNIPTPGYSAVNSYTDLLKAIAHHGLPGILKTRRFGYDGKGQFRIKNSHDIETAWQKLKGQPLIFESWVNFEMEVSLIAVRSKKGECAFYPLVHNEHHEGILALSRAPYLHPKLERQAHRYLTTLMTELNYVGVLTVEFFVLKGKLIANEMAPRVHNSGHWTIEGAETSQFENHIRAICGLPLGSTEARGYSGMINLIGQLPKPAAVLALEGAHYHDYAKDDVRPGRKMGHITITATSIKQREQRIKAALKTLKPSHPPSKRQS